MKSVRFFILVSFLIYWIGIVQGQSIDKNNRAALIIAIAEYDSPEAPPLPGVVADIVSAKKIAIAMGISEKNITVLRNQEATKTNIVNAFKQFSSQAADGGRAFIYFSGHGTRGYDPKSKNCYEGLLSYDRQVITHDEIAVATKTLNDHVDKSIIMFDACHSGGVINTQVQTRGAVSKLTPKFYSKASTGDLAMCSQPSNYRTRGLFENSSRLGALQENLVFISAARPDEVSYDEGSEKGGVATQALRDCLLGGAKDLDASGGVSLAEIQSCSQDLVNAKLPGPIYLPHHITIRGNRNLIPVVATNPTVIEPNVALTPPKPIELSQNNFNSSNKLEVVQPNNSVPVVPSKPNDLNQNLSHSSNKPEVVKPIQAPTTVIEPIKPSEIVQNTNNSIVKPEPIKPNKLDPVKPITQPIPPPAEQPIASLATLKDIEAQRNPTRKLDLQPVKKSLKINKDYLDLKIKSIHDVYLYLVLLGSDKKSFYVLYPNKLDGDNRIQAGKIVSLPSQSWQIKAAGPVGIDNILAIVADSPRDLKMLGALGDDSNSPFVYSLNTLEGRGQLINYLTKSVDGGSEKFAAQIISVSEVQ